ncbi:MAG: acyl-CoA dehydratase activase [Candidatus Azobacteroides sp.]|nr:acyl-CoA dehydratase activase [Candidatus Azobacteroides sp.]
MSESYKVGLDVGSTTMKVAVVNDMGNIIFSDYLRHNADVPGTLKTVFNRLKEFLGECYIELMVTGSAGMGLSERYKIPFLQEVVAAAEVISQKYPNIHTLIDIGGEDAKMIFFSDRKAPDMRMNGSCAGGTGAFIDQMATLLGVEVRELNALAEKSMNIYPIASRCGVFSKTDIQNLLARNVAKEDIAASVFHAVCLQTITSLARGHDIEPNVFFCGGPFAYIPSLGKAYVKLLNLKEDEYIISENAGVIPAWGCALYKREKRLAVSLSEFIRNLDKKEQVFMRATDRLKPLFCDEKDFKLWKKSKEQHFLNAISLSEAESEECYVGIDSGSTTTKIVAIDNKERVLFRHYAKNQGNPLQAVSNGMDVFRKEAGKAGRNFIIAGSGVTGYGEDLIKAGFGIEHGLVETIAHYSAAQKYNPNVSFILDIGGQDMKAIFVENGTINRLEINEACSSGCGSFIEGFAESLGYTAAEFSLLACLGQFPCDLGSRCTVFMNSKVKQFLREGAQVEDISAGLAYSVIKNCLYKVLKLTNTDILGDNIVVQGGTMRNLAVVRALELETGKSVRFSDMPELMGAYGAALYALRQHVKNPVRENEMVVTI